MLICLLPYVGSDFTDIWSLVVIAKFEVKTGKKTQGFDQNYEKTILKPLGFIFWLNFLQICMKVGLGNTKKVVRVDFFSILAQKHQISAILAVFAILTC